MRVGLIRGCHILQRMLYRFQVCDTLQTLISPACFRNDLFYPKNAWSLGVWAVTTSQRPVNGMKLPPKQSSTLSENWATSGYLVTRALSPRLTHLTDCSNLMLFGTPCRAPGLPPPSCIENE